MNKKGFLLTDSLISVVVISAMAIFCISLFSAYSNYQTGYENYLEETNDRYKEIFWELEQCEKCQIVEEQSPIEQ